MYGIYQKNYFYAGTLGVKSGDAKIKVAKNRRGETGEIYMSFNGALSRFEM